MAKRESIQFPVYLTKKKYRELFRKAQKECKTASPAHDVLDLLLVYYINNTFVLHRRMREVDKTKVKKKPDTKVWMRLPREENDIFTEKVTKERVSKTYIMNLLIDFYLRNEFEIETRIIRVNRR